MSLYDRAARITTARKHHKSPEQKRTEARTRQETYSALSLDEKIRRCANKTGRQYKRLLAQFACQSGHKKV